MLGPGENERTVNVFALQFERQQCLLLALFYKRHELFNALRGGRRRGNRHADWIVEETVAEFGNRFRHGRREEQGLALFWQQLVDALQRMDKAQVHHLVGFIENEDFNILQCDCALFDQVDQTARRCNEDIDAGGEPLFLAKNRHSAENAVNLEAEEFAIGAKAVGNLRGEFAGRREHQHPAAILLARFGLGREVMERRQRERCGLAGAGLRDTAQVAAL